MPNWCSSRLTIYGPKEDADGLRILMGTEEQSFDFEALLPSPDDLADIDEGVEEAYSLAYGDWEAHVDHMADKPKTREEAVSSARRRKWFRYVQYHPEPQHADRFPPKLLRVPISFDEAVEMGRESVRGHGHPSLGSWRMANWGTAWNCDYCCWLDRDSKEDVAMYTLRFGEIDSMVHDGVHAVEFDTRWSPPVHFVGALSRRFPSLVLKLEFWCRDGGYHGSCIWQAGVISDEKWLEYTAEEVEAYYGGKSAVVADKPTDGDAPQ
jgi:hypothetical protein